MCTTSNQPQAGNTDEQAMSAVDKEMQLAQAKLQLAQVRSNAEFNVSPAGQLLRQFETMQRIAKPFAESTIVPKQYQGNLGNCIIALDMAQRMNLPAFMVMKELYVVNGSPSWSAKFLVACIAKTGRFTNIRYKKRPLGKIGTIKVQKVEWVRDNAQSKNVKKTSMVDTDEFKDVDNWECIAYATEKATGEVLESAPVTIEMAILEGWYTKDGSKWLTMPMLMLEYRSAAFWQRVYAPEVSMGFPTKEEIEDTESVTDVEYEEVIDEAPAEEAPATPKKPRPTSASVETAKERLRQRESQASEQAAPAAGNNGQRQFDMP